jgi:hypothetical protein
MSTDRRSESEPRTLARAAGHGLAWSVLVSVGALLFHSSFEAWGDAIVDLGRDLWVPSQILEGRILYRELLYNYGPAAPYLLAAATGIFGDGLAVFAGFGTVVGLSCMAALYAVGTRLSGTFAGFAAALLFLTLSFFAASTWGCNFVLPYSFAATLGTAFSLWSFYFLLRYLDGGRTPASLAWSVAFLFAALFSKQEVGAGIAAVHVLAWVTRKVSAKAILSTLLAGVLLGGLFVALFAARGEAEHALFAENLTKFAGDPDPFFSVVAGLDRPGPHLVRSLASTAQVAALVLLAALGGFFLKSARLRLFAVPALAGCLWLVWRWSEPRLFQATPILALAALGFFLIRDRRDPLVLLAGFALFSAPRVLLQFHPMWYGFFLVVPAYPFLAVGAARLARGRRTVAAVLALTALVLAGSYAWRMGQVYEDKTSVLLTAKGRMRDFPDGRLEAVGELLRYAETRLASRSATMVVMPEGVSLNYFTAFPNPTAYYLFTPPEIGSPEVERKMMRELAAAPPDYLVLTSRDLSEYGRRGIGLDYALELGDWIRATYDLERVFEAGEAPSFRLLLLRRR